MKKFIKHLSLIAPVLLLAVMILGGGKAFAASSEYLSSTDDIQITGETVSEIIQGVTEATVELTKSDGTKVTAHVLLVKPDAKARFKAIVPGYYTEGSTKATRNAKAAAWKDSDWSVLGLSNMVKEYESAADTADTPVIAAINGDFGINYASGNAPRGSVVLEGKGVAHSTESVSVGGVASDYPAEDEWFFGPKSNGALAISGRSGTAASLYEEAVCGGAHILRSGELFGVDGETVARQRTGIALRPNGETLLITVESGISVKQLAQLMKASGCQDGINMDGGGSITFLTRRSGDTSVQRRTPDLSASYADRDENMERKISSGLILVADENAEANKVPTVSDKYTLELDKTTYQVGEEIKFKATAPIDRTWVGLYHKDDTIPDDMSYFWYDLDVADQGMWCTLNVNGGKVTEQDRHTSTVTPQHAIGTPLPADDYKVVLFEAYEGSGTYAVKASVDFTIIEEGSFKITYMDGDTELKGLTPSTYKESDVADYAIALQKPEKPGYTFVNWFTNASLTGRPVQSLAKGSTGDKVFYAKFNKNSYTLTFESNGGSEVGSITAPYQEAITKPEDPTKDGFIFNGWVTENGGSTLFDFDKGLSDNTTVYANWRDEGTHLVKFDSNGGSGVADQGVQDGEKAVKPADPTKEGFTFKGWFSDKELTKSFDFENTPITEDITLYAKWTEKFEDKLILSEESRGDKTYTSGASDYVGEKLFEYFYGDTVTVEATAEEPGAWVGVFQDSDFISKNFDNVVDKNWYYVDDYINKDDRRVDLRTVNGSNLPFGINYWAVLLSKDNKVLKAVPFNYRTFNVDRPEVVEKKIKAELEWTSKVANGEDQKPALTIKQVNEHFNGTFEETLVEGKDYTVQYPASSSDPGSYSIKVKYASPSSDNSDGHIHYMGNTEYEYEYYLTASEGDYVVTYELGGGTNHGDNPEIFHAGTEIVLKSPSKIGYSFDGWTCNGEPITVIPADAEKNYKVKANWVADEDAPYAIKYVLNGGSNVVENPDHYTGNVDIDIIPASKGGYAFDGWFFDEAFTKPADVIPKGNEGDVTLYAKFTKNGSSARFSITTDVTGGDISSNKTVASGGSYTVKYTPNEGYVLSEILVDGEPVDIAAFPAEYTFENVTKSHSIAVTFKKTSGGDTPEESDVEIGTIVPYNGNTYVVTSVKNKTVALSVAKNAKSVTVPATVTVDGAKFKVTGIKSKAFKSSKATTVYIKTKSLSKARVKTSLKSSKVKTVRVKVSTKKATNKKYVKKYKKYFTKANAGRKVTIK